MVVPSYDGVTFVESTWDKTYDGEDDGEIIPPKGMDYPDSSEDA